ncbi:MAG: diguanylate cyclase [Spirochaetales bacterium]|nr:diguanylate cyclase [Spirochaetales bacterium]
MTPKEIYSLISSLNKIFDIVRVVDPQLMEVIVVNSNGSVFTDKFKCHEVWNKTDRCENCISLKACRTRSRQEKFEFIGDEVYHVTVKPMDIGGSTYALEIVSHVENNVLVSAFGKQQFAALVKNINQHYAADAQDETQPSESEQHIEDIMRSVILKEPHPAAGDLANMKILIADDNEADATAASKLLQSNEAETVTVHSGVDAINAFTYHSADPFDAILLNVDMPKMSGIETAKIIRNMDLAYADTIPLIAVSDKNDDELKKVCIDAGMNGLLQKPLSLTSVTRAMLGCMKYQSDILRHKLTASKLHVNVDPLTGVRNITAYTEMISELTENIKTHAEFNFAIVLFDINGLKSVNDTYGHDVGDTFIKNCSQIICEVFKHSPVFRIGGDEFAAVLCGEDYHLRSQRMNEIARRVSAAEQISDFSEGAASFAYGMSEYDRSKDDGVAKVIKRADECMLERKNVMSFSKLSS